MIQSYFKINNRSEFKKNPLADRGDFFSKVEMDQRTSGSAYRKIAW